MREQGLLTRRSVAAALPIAALVGAGSMAPAAVQASMPADDAELLDLGRRWAAQVAAVRAHDRTYHLGLTAAEARAHEAAADRLFATEQMLFYAIVSTPARTVQGLAVKAEALAREHDVGDRGEDAIAAALRRTGDLQERAALSLALDVLRLAGAA